MTQALHLQTQFQRYIQDIVKRKSRDAFSALFDFFAPRLKTYFMQTGLSPEQAEDVVQDTMVQVWRKADQYDPERAAVSSWIFMIGKSRLVDAVRRTRRPELDPDDPFLSPPQPQGPEPRLEHREIGVRIKDAIRGLPEEQQTVLRASFYQGLSHSEIAKRYELPLGTVKSRLRLAMNAMRQGVSEALEH